MSAKSSDLESRAGALLKRIQRHNIGIDSLTAVEVRSLLEEIRAIRKMIVAGSLPDDVLARVDLIMKQAVQEASGILAGVLGHGTKNQKA